MSPNNHTRNIVNNGEFGEYFVTKWFTMFDIVLQCFEMFHNV